MVYLASEYHQMLDVGIDVDWAKTNPGRVRMQKAIANGINVPEIFYKRGFDHVRIRVREDINSSEKFKTGKTLLEEVEDIIDLCLKSNIIPILAYRADDFKNEPSQDSLDTTVDWWKKAFETFVNKDYKLSYNFIIETAGAIKKYDEVLNGLYSVLVSELNKIDPQRIRIYCPNNISRPEKLQDLQLHEPQNKLIIEWHCYAAGASKTNPRKLWTTGTPEEKELITSRFDVAKAWSEDKGIPTWVGAWMANNYNEQDGAVGYCDYDNPDPEHFLQDCAPATGDYSVQEQVKFAKFFGSELKKRGIPYAVNSDTKFFDRKKNEWFSSMETVLEAILNPV